MHHKKDCQKIILWTIKKLHQGNKLNRPNKRRQSKHKTKNQTMSKSITMMHKKITMMIIRTNSNKINKKSPLKYKANFPTLKKTLKLTNTGKISKRRKKSNLFMSNKTSRKRKKMIRKRKRKNKLLATSQIKSCCQK